MKAAIQKHAATLTDREIAEKYRIPTYRVTRARQRLGIKKLGYRHKVTMKVRDRKAEAKKNKERSLLIWAAAVRRNARDERKRAQAARAL